MLFHDAALMPAVAAIDAAALMLICALITIVTPLLCRRQICRHAMLMLFSPPWRYAMPRRTVYVDISRAYAICLPSYYANILDHQSSEHGRCCLCR